MVVGVVGIVGVLWVLGVPEGGEVLAWGIKPRRPFHVFALLSLPHITLSDLRLLISLSPCPRSTNTRTPSYRSATTTKIYAGMQVEVAIELARKLAHNGMRP